MLRQAWSTGNLRWKLDPNQQAMYDEIYASHKTVESSLERQFFLDVARQSGKDFIMSTIASETAYRHRDMCRIVYAAPTKDRVHRLLVPTLTQVFQDCPPDLLPKEMAAGTWLTNSKELTWPWGAKIELIGVDLHPDWIRGPATFAIMFTECAFVENFDDIMKSVILPQLLTQPDGFVIYGSTPPTSPGHAWSTKYIPRAKQRGMCATRTIDQCPRINKAQRDAAIKELGGPKSTQTRRELYVEHIVESTLAVIPEYADVRNEIFTEEGFENKPRYRDCWVSVDPGFNHATGALFGYIDFDKALVMIEGDFAVRYANSREVARLIFAREWQLWGIKPKKPREFTDQAWKEELEQIRSRFYPNLREPTQPVQSYRSGQLQSGTYRRVSDTESRLIADMSQEHGLVISPTEKDNLDLAVNALRLAIQRMRWRIHPRCVNLDMHLSQGTWNTARTKFAESGDGGHFDCIPAAVYLQRNIQYSRNPNPPYRANPATHFIPAVKKASDKTSDALEKVFQRTKSKGRRGRR